MRSVLFVLVLANAAYFAWANWIETPPLPRSASATQTLPRLQLASEASVGAEAARVALAAPPPEAPPARCVSVGPFEDLAAVGRAAATLQERGLQTRQRAERGTPYISYWVYVGGLQSAEDESRILRRLERGRIRDAQAMPETAAGRRVSVGLFSDRAGAERRARAVETLGIKPEVAEQQQTGAAYWIDFDLAARDSAIAAEGLLDSGGSGSRIEIRACPGAIERPAQPAPAGTEPQSSSPVRVGAHRSPATDARPTMAAGVLA